MVSEHHPLIESLLVVIDLLPMDLMPIMLLCMFLMAIGVINKKQDLHMRAKSPEKMTTKISRIKNRESLIEKYQENKMSRQTKYQGDK
jgi:hypothetical protein